LIGRGVLSLVRCGAVFFRDRVPFEPANGSAPMNVLFVVESRCVELAR
jgi:hypothetical protein